MAVLCCPDHSSSPATRAHQFLAILPRIQAYARFSLRSIRCSDRREDLTAEIVALAWQRFLALQRRGKDPAAFATTLALRCSQAVRTGRRLTRTESPRDVLSPLARSRGSFSVVPLDDTPREDATLADALAGNTRSAVPDQVAFRIDFPRWRRRFDVRKRRILEALMFGEGTGLVASRFGLTPGRVSQLRGEFRSSWDEFQTGESDGSRCGGSKAGSEPEH